MVKKTVKDTDIIGYKKRLEYYISLTGSAKVRERDNLAQIISFCQKTYNTIEYIGLWEVLNNPEHGLQIRTSKAIRRKSDNVWISNFVIIISPKHMTNPAQKRVMVIQVAVIARRDENFKQQKIDKKNSLIPPLKGVGGCFCLLVICSRAKQSRNKRLNLDIFVPVNDKLENIPLPPSKGEFRKLVNFSMFEKSIFSLGSLNDGVTSFVFISNPSHGKFLQRDNMEYTQTKPVRRLPERVYCIPRTATLSDEARGYPCIVSSDFILQQVINCA